MECSIATVSVVILNWNGQAHLAECLPALAKQTRLADEVIVVDNGSTRDDSVRFVQTQFPNMRCVALSENVGFSGGNNAGLAAATGDAIVLLNNDTRPAADWLEKLLQCAAGHPEAGIIAAHLVDWEGRTTDSAGDGCRVTGRGYGRHRRQPAETAPRSGPVFGACAGAALYRRELIRDVGFLDEDFFLNFEDTDLAFRAQLRGWPVWFCREAVVNHRVSASQGAWSATNVFYGARNHLWVCVKNLPAALLVKNSPLIGFEIFALMLVATRRGRLWPYLRGLAAGLGGIPRTWRKRREIQKRRTVTTAALEAWLTRPNFTLDAARRLWRAS